MSDIPSTVRNPRSPEPEQYDIRVTGHLVGRWNALFDGMTLTPHDDGTTVIHGPIADQAALHGLLRKVSDLGLPLLSVEPARHDPSTRRSTT